MNATSSKSGIFCAVWHSFDGLIMGGLERFVKVAAIKILRAFDRVMEPGA
ncbi:hypothetical protein LJC74_08330 [Eubacteriales bacterium OttesenSCG-928-A19]|nr:hypothetical protein [Eubacteriales bacterium OttesenSCG-928-A19]